jgi:predicted dinucleotide-binding enzyme
MGDCMLGSGTIEALKMAGAGALDGKIVVDLSNPLDFSKGMPPSLFIGTLTRWAKRCSASSRRRAW